MKQQYRIDIRMLSGGYEGPGAAFNEDFFITNDIVNTPQMYMFGMPMRFDALVIGLTRKGTMEANFNLRPFAARENQLMLSIPENLVELKGVSADYQGWYVAISMDYLRKLDVNIGKTVHLYPALSANPFLSIAPERMEYLCGLLDILFKTLQEYSEKDYSEPLVRNLMSAFVNAAYGFGMEQLDSISHVRSHSKDGYFLRFLSLLQEDATSQREIKHYADKLSLTPKYFSEIIKDVSGNSAAEWIASYTIAEASLLIRFSGKTMEQIADDLNFSSLAAFSKYFKQHTGKTPSEYRKG